MPRSSAASSRPPLAPWTRERWRAFARGYIKLRADRLVEDLAFADSIGDACYERNQRGEDACILHEVAAKTGAPCYCARCLPDVRRIA